MNDRILGYTVIGIVILFLFLPIGYLKWKSSKPVITRTIAFKGVKSLSFISVQDPVLLKGVEVGTVRNVSIEGTSALVEIETSRSITLHEDYSITVVAKGVMGDRSLSILPGDDHTPIISPETLLYGRVSIGPDDALSYMESLQSAVHTLATISEELKNGTVRRQSLIIQIRQFTADIDSVIKSILSLFSEIDTSLKQGIDSTVIILEETISLSRKINDGAPATITSIKTMLLSMDKVLTQVDSLMIKADEIIKRIEAPDIIIWKKHTGSITNNLTALHRLLREIESDSLTLPVRFW
ncbi:MAG: MCE family protein [Chitinispirillaceae bacterium]|nr:MCE family protein [Chitinispirillaceae bacterium]